jgi:hypothetical protein
MQCSGIVQYPSLDLAGLMTQQQVLDMQGEAGVHVEARIKITARFTLLIAAKYNSINQYRQYV